MIGLRKIRNSKVTNLILGKKWKKLIFYSELTFVCSLLQCVRLMTILLPIYGCLMKHTFIWHQNSTLAITATGPSTNQITKFPLHSTLNLYTFDMRCHLTASLDLFSFSMVIWIRTNTVVFWKINSLLCWMNMEWTCKSGPFVGHSFHYFTKKILKIKILKKLKITFIWSLINSQKNRMKYQQAI